MATIGSALQNSWVQQQPGFTQARFDGQKRSYQAFSKKPLNNAIMFYLFAEIVQRTIGFVIKNTKKEINKNPSNFGSDIRIDLGSILKGVNYYADDFEKQFKEDVNGIANKGSLYNQTGLSSKDYIQCAGLAKNFAVRFFRENKLVIPNPLITEDMMQWRLYMACKSIDSLYQFIGSKHVKAATCITKQLDAFGIDKNKVVKDLDGLSCFAYAFLYVAELEAKNFIFRENEAEKFGEIFDLLTQWNYASVPNPDKGDLVVYITDNGQPQHMAVFIEDQLVHSKMGNLNPYSYDHKLFDVLPIYGNQVIFFRKGPSLS